MQAFDTNILAYASGLRQIDSDEPKIEMAAHFVRAIIVSDGVAIPAQVLAELHNVLRRKGKLSSADAGRVISDFAAGAVIVATDFSVLESAFALAQSHKLQTYDAIVLAASARAGCDVLYSEDMQNGFEWSGVRVVNPFA